MTHWIKIGLGPLLPLLAACVVLAQGPSASANVMMFISNYGSSAASPLAYDTSAHTLTTIDSKFQVSSTFVGTDPSNPGQLDLFVARGINGSPDTTTIYTYFYNPVANTYGPAQTFVSGITDESRGMVYSSLNNTIYLTTVEGSNGEVRQINATTGSQGTPINFSAGNRPFGVTVDSSGVLWIATFPSGLYKYDPSAPSPTPTLVFSPPALLARDTIAPANFDGGVYAGDIFITDLTNNRIEFYNPVTTASGTLPDTSGLLNGPAGIGFNPVTGDLYVTNSANNTVVEYNTVTAKFQYATNLGPGNGILNGPNNLSFFIAPEPASATILALTSLSMLPWRRKN